MPNLNLESGDWEENEKSRTNEADKREVNGWSDRSSRLRKILVPHRRVKQEQTDY